MAGHTRNAHMDEIADRRAQVAELTLNGFSQRQIAKRLGIALGTVNNDLQAVRQEWAEQRSATYEQHVGAMMARLTQMERTLARGLVEGDLPTIDRALKVLDRRARLLGLDVPQAVSVDFDVEAGRRRIREFLEAAEAGDGSDADSR